MSGIWNEFELQRPPLVTLPVKDAKFVTRLHPALRNYFQRDKEQMDEFEFTAALLARMTVRRQNSFRNMIGLRSIRKINVALCRLLRVDLKREITNFQSTLPDLVLSLEGNNEVATRNCLDYLLLRLIAVHELHVRINDCCVEAADYFSKMLRKNYFFDTNALLLAVLGKLFTLNIIMDKKCIALYKSLLNERVHFPSRLQCEFLPKDFEFPKRLQQIQLIGTSEAAAVSGSDATIQKPSVEECIVIARSTTTPKSQIFTQETKKRKLPEADVGVAISRPANKPVFDGKQLQNAKDVLKFIKSESAARKQKSTDFATKNIKDHEWLAVVKLFENKMRAKQEEKAVNIFRKFINSKV